MKFGGRRCSRRSPPPPKIALALGPQAKYQLPDESLHQTVVGDRADLSVLVWRACRK
jgi:hypothetical protein